MGIRRGMSSALVSIILTAIVWEISDQIPRMTFIGKIFICAFIFFISYIIGSILSGGK